jgi:proline iminopeptidase
MSTLETKAGHVHYAVEGDGPPILLVPGGPGSSHHRYPELTVQHQVVYFDPLGTGQSDRLTNPQDYTVGLYAETILALLDHLEIAQAHIIGRSFGGVPAAEFAARHPERTKTLVLSNAQIDAESWQIGNLDAMNHHLRHQYPEIWAELMQLRAAGVRSSDERYVNLIDAPTEQMRWAGLEPIAVAPTPGSSFDESTYLAFTGDDPEWTLGGTLQGHTVLDRLAVHRIPTLVITGRHDLMASPALAKRIADALHPDSTRFVILERSAHFPWAEEPETYFALLHEFMALHS